MHEMGEIKRAQEFRADEVSVQNIMGNHETIPQLTSSPGRRIHLRQHTGNKALEVKSKLGFVANIILD